MNYQPTVTLSSLLLFLQSLPLLSSSNSHDNHNSSVTNSNASLVLISSVLEQLNLVTTTNNNDDDGDKSGSVNFTLFLVILNAISKKLLTLPQQSTAMRTSNNIYNLIQDVGSSSSIMFNMIQIIARHLLNNKLNTAINSGNNSAMATSTMSQPHMGIHSIMW